MSGTKSQSALPLAASEIAKADGLIITAGAGMGVDSGLPDFRGNEGFWKAYPPLQRAGLSFASAATPALFHERPTLAWGFYGHRLRLYRSTDPHEGFDILRRWGESKPNGYFVYTSNVDGHFQKAGFNSRRVAECHGSIHRMQCLDGCGMGTWPANQFDPDVDAATCTLRGALPRCPHCGGVCRPNILMFDDGDWIGDRYEQMQSEMAQWIGAPRCPVFIELGAGIAVPTIRWFGDRAPGPLIRINLRDHRVTWPKDISIAAAALEALKALDDLIAL